MKTVAGLRGALVGLALVAGWCAAAGADELLMNDGRVLAGKVKAIENGEVVFTVLGYGTPMDMTFRLPDIKKITYKELTGSDAASLAAAAGAPTTTTKPPASQPRVADPKYCLVPMHGAVGREILAEKVKLALDAAPREPNVTLLFEFDSPGGRLSECEKLIKLLAEHKDRRTVALVKSSYSAAAILTLTCKEIYMDPAGTIGAATAYKTTAAGPTAIEEKFMSVWRSNCRTAADLGGHNPLLAEAMVDRKMQLRIVEKNGKPDVEQFLKLTDEDLRKGNVLVAENKVLTMTAKEAVKCGLAAGVAESVNQLALALNMAGWEQVGQKGTEAILAHEKETGEIGRQIKEQCESAEKSWKLAEASSPQKGVYSVDAAGRLTPAGKIKYEASATTCANYLQGCEVYLNKIIELAGKRPAFEEEADWAKHVKTDVSTLRQAMQDRIKRGV